MVGVPWAMAFVEEQQIIEMERTERAREVAGEVCGFFYFFFCLYSFLFGGGAIFIFIFFGFRKSSFYTHGMGPKSGCCFRTVLAKDSVAGLAWLR